ncbi:hypothetical protein D4R86_00385 [bacterium]|nr:MAG: hypothetical protein D4R86_00385 [bacterium]
MVSEVDRQFMIENDLSQVRLKLTQYEFFFKQLTDAIGKLQLELSSVRGELSSAQAEIKEIKAKN